MGSANPESDPSASHLYSTVASYAAYYTQNPNFNQHQTSFYSQLQPPGVETIPYVSQPPVNAAAAYAPAQQAHAHDPNVAAAAAAAASYYGDQNAMLQNWIVSLKQMGVPIASGVTAPNPATQSKKSSAWVKYPKKTKIVQSAWCEICKIDCNSKGVLDQHKLGKKHQKNLEKLRAAAMAPANIKHAASSSLLAPTATPAEKPVIGPEENPNKSKAATGENPQKKAGVKTEDLETKKRKVLEGGAAANAVRTCIICNVVCNSETVFKYHIAGQKHATMIKKYASMTGVTFAG